MQEVAFSHDGRPFLHYSSRSWLLEPDGTRGRPGRERGGLVAARGRSARRRGVLAHPTGIVELLVGRVAFRKVELGSDAVVRTATAKEVTATSRLYGGVEGDLAYVVEMAAVGQPLQPHLSARLQRVDGSGPG